MPDAISDALQRYSERYTSPEPPLLQQLNRDTHLKMDQAQMLSGHVQGRFLSLFSRLVQPKSILEVGTFTGYSALCLAEGLSQDGLLHTMDCNDELAESVRATFRQSPYAQRIAFHLGRALDLIPQIPGTFDLVFLDADKEGYEAYFDLVIDRVPSGGFILADNVLYHGEVLDPPETYSNNARWIDAFNRKIRSDERVEVLLLTLRDGLLIMKKK